MVAMLMSVRTFITNNVNTQKSFEYGCIDITFFTVLKTYRMARLEDFRSNTQLCLLVESCFILSSGFRITGKTTDTLYLHLYK